MCGYSKRTVLTVESPVGPLTIVVEDGALTKLQFGARSGALASPDEEDVALQLREYFAGSRHAFSIAVAPQGTDFQRAVWNELTKIPFGETVSYRDIAERLGRRGAERAVGAANGANPVAIVIPCHRVIGSNRSLTGYGGGIAAKQWLLAHEGRRLF
jgi:methylated-DNA-[protein]-cysteine S-methyltransferase